MIYKSEYFLYAILAILFMSWIFGMGYLIGKHQEPKLVVAGEKLKVWYDAETDTVHVNGPGWESRSDGKDSVHINYCKVEEKS